MEGPILEREEQLGQLDAVLDDARTGSGRMVVVEGLAGTGKTSLLAEARERAKERGFAVLTARAADIDQEFAFGVVRQLFTPRLRDAADREALLSGAAALAAPALGLDAATAAKGGQADAFAAMHGLYWLTATLAEDGPLLVAIDDVHWADTPSLRFAEFLGRRIGELPVALVATVRTSEDSASSPPVARIRAEAGDGPIEVGPLSVDAITAILAHGLGPEPAPEFARAAHKLVGGNPLLLSQLLVELRGAGVEPSADQAARIVTLGPQSISTAIVARLGALPPAAATVAKAVAVLDSGATPARAASLTGLSADEVAVALDSLAGAEILQPAEELGFVHPIVRNAIYSDVPARERSAIHRDAAKLFEAEGGAEAEAASHLLHCDPAGDEAVVGVLRTAAGAALARGAPETAVDLLTRAQAEPPEEPVLAAVLGELGRARWLTGDPAAAGELEHSLRISVDPGERAARIRELARILGPLGQAERAIELIEAELGRLDRGGELALLLEADLATVAMFDPRKMAALRARLRARALGLRGETSGELALLAGVAVHASVAGEPAAEVIKLASRALAGGRLLAEHGPDSITYGFAIVALMCSGAYPKALAHADDGLREARAIGSAGGACNLLWIRAGILHRMGLVGDALAEIESALELANDQSLFAWVPGSMHVWLLCKVERGELDDADRRLGELGFDAELPDTGVFNMLLDSRAQLRLAQGKDKEALADLREVSRRDEVWQMRHPDQSPWRSCTALVLAARGEQGEARELADEEIGIARAIGSPRALGGALRVRGLIDAGDGVPFLREGLDVLEDSGAELERARTRVELGAALRRANRRAEGRELLRSGLALAESCGATALAGRAREELAASGAKLRDPRALSGVGSLTPSEVRVARLAAAGQTNKQIAQALFVTLRTVETHLTQTYRKLEISSRGDLPGALAGGEGDDPAQIDA